MTVKELKEELNKWDDSSDVLTFTLVNGEKRMILPVKAVSLGDRGTYLVTKPIMTSDYRAEGN